jgi:ABC-type phosphate transport system permease subunit
MGSCKNIVLFLYSLVVIAELTLYFDESQNELAVGLTLTIMLVMYTMYQSINDSFVKTAYLKMIDYWLLFCLLTPLAVFLIEIFWLLNKTKESLKAEQKKWTSKDNKKKEMSNRRFVQILVPSLTIIFTVSYFAVAIGISFYFR